MGAPGKSPGTSFADFASRHWRICRKRQCWAEGLEQLRRFRWFGVHSSHCFTAKIIQNSKFHVLRCFEWSCFNTGFSLVSITHIGPRGLAVQHVNRLKPRFLLVSGDLTNVKALCWLMANLDNFKHLAELIRHVWNLFETCCLSWISGKFD